MKTILVTGGAGFIGSCYVLMAVNLGYRVINLDKLTYSGNLGNLQSIQNNPLHVFVRGDIGNFELVQYLCREYQPQFVVNFAAESHVDRSILDPEAFVRTNVLGTTVLLRAVKEWYDSLDKESALYKEFRFLHVSTDEVFGALKPGEKAFTEKTAFALTARIQQVKRPVTILCGHIMKPMDFRLLLPIAPIITVRGNFRKNSFRL